MKYSKAIDGGIAVNEIKVNFKNCYGIRNMEHLFNLSEGNVFLIYAPNGSMKTSFAKTFDDISKEQLPKDAIFSERETCCFIYDENNEPIVSDQILVVEPYADDYTSEKTALLMVDKELRMKYEGLVRKIDDKLSVAMDSLKSAAGLGRNEDITGILSDLFNSSDKDAYTLFEKLYGLIENKTNQWIHNIQYRDIFNDKVIQFLSKDEIYYYLEEYIDRLNELIDRSKFYRRGLFNHNNAYIIQKTLSENKFFQANHSILLADRSNLKQEITSTQEFDSALENEKKEILSDPKLAKIFGKIDKEITRNIELRRFRNILEENQEIISELTDMAQLKLKLWLTYAFSASKELEGYVSVFRGSKKEIATIMNKAKEQETKWREVLTIFYGRFSVPFTISLVNQHEVILKNETPSFVFKYQDSNDICEIGGRELLNVLSTGEKRALYLLNVIYEIEARTMQQARTVLVLDDIADSFDYKNKYAIVEYLKDIMETDKFAMIILTHNFDFFRTVQGRLSVRRKQNCFMSVKSDDTVTLVQADYLNPFLHWRNNLHKNSKMLIASIPMLRNLIEYTIGEEDEHFNLLTSLLHYKHNTKNIKMSDLTDVVEQLMDKKIIYDGNEDELVYERIISEAERCREYCDQISLENKVILSIAIRLCAELFIITKINDTNRTANINKNQTGKLIELFKHEHPEEKKAIKTLDKVAIMTPETIHLNSFMFEPILDMSDEHLISLYSEVKSL